MTENIMAQELSDAQLEGVTGGATNIYLIQNNSNVTVNQYLVISGSIIYNSHIELIAIVNSSTLGVIGGSPAAPSQFAHPHRFRHHHHHHHCDYDHDGH